MAMTSWIKSDPILHMLISRRFPDAVSLLGRNGEGLSSDDERRLKEIEQYALHLDWDMPLHERRALEEQEQRAFDAEEQFFFSRYYTNADFSYWSKMAYWEHEEAVALSFGKCPKEFNAASLQDRLSVSPIVIKYRRLMEWINRAKRMGQLADPVPPGSFIAWARQNEIELAPGLEAAVAALGQNGKDLHPKERETALTLIIAMAVKRYNYDPGKARNEAIKLIAKDVGQIGKDLHEDTVRKWLREASELL